MYVPVKYHACDSVVVEWALGYTPFCTISLRSGLFHHNVDGMNSAVFFNICATLYAGARMNVALYFTYISEVESIRHVHWCWLAFDGRSITVRDLLLIRIFKKIYIIICSETAWQRYAATVRDLLF